MERTPVTKEKNNKTWDFAVEEVNEKEESVTIRDGGYTYKFILRNGEPFCIRGTPKQLSKEKYVALIIQVAGILRDRFPQEINNPA